jgi:hypothetical protein
MSVLAEWIKLSALALMATFTGMNEINMIKPHPHPDCHYSLDLASQEAMSIGQHTKGVKSLCWSPSTSKQQPD